MSQYYNRKNKVIDGIIHISVSVEDEERLGRTACGLRYSIDDDADCDLVFEPARDVFAEEENTPANCIGCAASSAVKEAST